MRSGSWLRWALAFLVVLPVWAGPSPSAVAEAGSFDGKVGLASQARADQPSAVEPTPAPPAAEPALPDDLPLEPVYSQPAYLSLPGGTTVNPESFYSVTLGRTMPYEVILPPDYAASGRSYPVVYLLHGYGGWSHSWIELGLHLVADYLWSEGGLPPFIIVLPEGENSFFFNHADDGVRWGDYLALDVVDEIDTYFRTLGEPRFRAIGGLSMGGDGALQVALNNPDVFGIVGAHSPSTRPVYDDAVPYFYGDAEHWQQNNPLWLIENTAAAHRLQISIDIGEGDAWLGSARALHETLLSRQVPHRYVEAAGGHTAEYWIASSPGYLDFYADAFERAASPAPADTPSAAAFP